MNTRRISADTLDEYDALEVLARLVKVLEPHLASPNYHATGVYSAQWRAKGSVYEYHLPGRTEPLAVVDKARGTFRFCRAVQR